jgi:hypothetical protein
LVRGLDGAFGAWSVCRASWPEERTKVIANLSMNVISHNS